MKCEICKTIEKLGLDPATHDPWMCADKWSARETLLDARISLHHRFRDFRHRMQAGWHTFGRVLHRQAHYVTLGL